MILTYELKDDPGYEHELEVDTVEEALAFVDPRADMIEWAELTEDEDQNIISVLI